MILVPLLKPEVRDRICRTMCANFGFGALVDRFQSSNHMRPFETAAFFGLKAKLQQSSFMESVV